jgi:hypothetical protein
MTTMTEVTPVLFRVWDKPNSGVIALFPDDVVDDEGHVGSYEHVGQHGGANYHLVMAASRPALPAEYAALKKELESAPYEYRFRVYQRWTRRD